LTNKFGETALHVGVKAQADAAVRLLTARYPLALKTHDNDGNTPLHSAVAMFVFSRFFLFRCAQRHSIDLTTIVLIVSTA
jgi:hypothetical protein